MLIFGRHSSSSIIKVTLGLFHAISNQFLRSRVYPLLGLLLLVSIILKLHANEAH